MVKVATHNYPHRLDRSGEKRKANFTKMSNDKITVIAVQEITDKDIFRIVPKGWGHWRPGKAESAGIMWKKSVWSIVNKGRVRINSESWKPIREIVWVRLRKRNGVTRTFASVHLVAFKTSRPQNGREYRKQVKRVANWLVKQPKDTVLLGDWNGTPGDGWMDALETVANSSRPLFKTGPNGQYIDFAWKSKSAKTKPKGIKRWPKSGSDHYGYVADV